MNSAIIATILGLHVVATFAGWIVARRRGRFIGGPYLCFALALPPLGAALSWLFAISRAPETDINESMMRRARQQEPMLHLRDEAERIVPLEEAFLINQPRKRRELMMDLLKSDPRKYLDLLLLARFNEDQETAHYASVTLTEVQRQMHLGIQQAQAELEEAPQDRTVRVKFVERLNAYVNSGLLEGWMLKQQRWVLQKALEDFPVQWDTPEISSVKVDNALALGLAHDARRQAMVMMDRWPRDERSYLKMLEVCVQTGDSKAMRALMERIRHSEIDWTHDGLERIHYFDGRSA